MTIREIFRNTSLDHQISPPEREILLSLALGRPREYILAHPEKKLTRLQIAKFTSYAKRRASGEPAAYIAGEKEFYNLDFIVNKNVLIPRPETELLVEEIKNKIQNTRYKIPDTVIDVGTGSGNIIISIYKNLPQKIKDEINFYAVDISSDALKIAKKNAKKHKVEKKIKFVQSDLLDYFFVKEKTPSKADQPLAEKKLLIVANLPYVSPELYQRNKNNLKFEPKRALWSKQAGLSHYKKLLKQIRLLAADHCSLFFEISPEQKPEICRLIKKILPKAKVGFLKDLSGKWRAAAIEI